MRLTDVLDAYLEALDAGAAPDRETLLKQHPDLAEELAATLDGLDFVHRAARTVAGAGEDAAPGRALGDYRLVREIGRGGMAVVYEAEQVSLGRRVALKVLPFAAVLDPKQLQRFKNEAMAAAHLRHPNIVPVHGVGSERGVHYYAMQYVEGQSLAAAIGDMKGGGAGEGARTPISSHASHREPGYIRMAAALGVQAAEALDHAHQLGIVHRDVKPGNLLVDLAGTLWITDFGLARSHQDVGLTMTGEILGTIRYMSPEQALAKRVPVDHRTDVYSLGATLYELFTLEPAFRGDDAHVVIQDIATREPTPPRKLNAALPRDLETVILKAMSKDPAGRYATAQEMADDLGRCLEDKPILARRPSVPARAARWSRQHRTLVAASFLVLLLAVAGLLAYSIRVADEQTKTRAALAVARDAVDKFLVEAGITDFEDQPLPPPARRELLTAALRSYGADDPDALRTRAKILHAMHEYAGALAALDRALAIRPLDVLALAERGHMLWHLQRHDEALAAAERAITVDSSHARAYFYRGLAHAESGRTEQAIEAYRVAVRLKPDDAVTHFNLGTQLSNLGNREDAVREFRETIRFQPNNPDPHHRLGICLMDIGETESAIQEFREAIRLRPDDASARTNLGYALVRSGEFKSAIRELRDAIRIDPDHATAHFNLGIALWKTHDVAGAVEEYRRAIQIRPDYVDALVNLGNALRRMNDLKGAIAALQEAVRLKPNDGDAHGVLGDAFWAARDADGALREWQLAVRHDPENASAHRSVGLALHARGDYAAAIRENREAVRLDPEDAEAHVQLGMGLLYSDDLVGAAASFRDAIRLRPNHAMSHNNLGIAIEDSDPQGAIACYREVLRLEPDDPNALCNLGYALSEQGLFREALPLLRRGHDLGSKRPGWSYPSGDWVAMAEGELEMEARLDRALAEGSGPRNALERVSFAWLLHAKSLHLASATMYAAAFAQDATLAEDLERSHRYLAACSAVRAAAFGGPDAAQWRGRALEWLRADLAARQKAPDHSGLLTRWKGDASLAAVRDRIDDLPEAERDAWRRLWAAVSSVLASARPR